jgi:hypothetical protein
MPENARIYRNVDIMWGVHEEVGVGVGAGPQGQPASREAREASRGQPGARQGSQGSQPGLGLGQGKGSSVYPL